MVTEENQDVTAGGDGAAAPQPARDSAEIPEQRRALVKKWIERVKADKEHHKKAFDRMRDSMKIAANGSDSATYLSGDNYVVPVLNRYINTAVAALYAKNPKAVAKRKPKLMHTIWDGDLTSLQAAMAAVQQPQLQPVADEMGQPVVDPMTGQPQMQPVVDPQAAALVEEVMAVKEQIVMLDRMAKTLQLLFAYYFDEQDAGYKEQFKALVRRGKVCGVGYVELGFQRVLQEQPDIAARIADVTSEVTRVETLLAQMSKEDSAYDGHCAEAEELRLSLNQLQERLEIVVREGPVLSFPRATEIIPDKECRHLKTFAGARWVTREFDMTPERILEVYKVDIRGDYTAYTADGKETQNKSTGCARVWRIQDKRNNQVLTVCDGYPDFLQEPAEPDVKIERFWTIFPLVFNEVETDDSSEISIFPPSDVWNARHMQREYNSSRQGLREHRIAARPRPVSAKGRLEDADKLNLGQKAAFELVELNSLATGEKVDDLIQWMKTPGVDPNLYEVETTFADIQRSVGAQEANFGGTSGDTATESSIAENSRQTTNSSDVDDLDTMLSALARAMGQLMLLEISKDKVIEIVGPGAVWPDLPPRREEVVKDLALEIEAGSSGRPNVAAELAKMERAMPFVTQLPGINPIVPAKKYATLLDWDVEEAIVEGLPSIVALNQANRNNQAGGNPDADPGQQGDKGRQNTPSTQTNEPQSQPAFPAPTAGPSSG